VAFLPTAPAGQWKYESRPIGAQLWASFFDICVVGLAAGSGEYAFGTGGDSPVFGIPALVLMAAILIRARRIGVWADGDRIAVQNLWRTYEFGWAEVATVEALGWAPQTPPRCVFRMHQGSAVRALGVPLALSGASDVARDLAQVSRSPVKVVDR
jgi:hypothetical protein